MSAAAKYQDRVERLRNDDSACPVAAGFTLAWHDDMPLGDDEQLIGPLLPLLPGSAGGGLVTERRAFMVADWFFRSFVPAWMRVAEYASADAVEALPEMLNQKDVHAAAPMFPSTALHAAALYASAGGAALLTASKHLERDPVLWGLTHNAWRVALVAAASATPNDVDATVKALQASAVDLVHRMIAAKDTP